jgi:DNA invertase Pin-like site-specific DNA recombinase
VVAKLDRLSRSMIEFTALIGLARRQRWLLGDLQRAASRISARTVP